MPRSAATSPACSYISRPVHGSRRPSCWLASTSSTSPKRKPRRAPMRHVRGARHGLHAAREDHAVLAEAHERVADGDGPQAGGADLVDGLGADVLGDAGRERDLARRDVALAGLDDGADDAVLDVLGGEAAALDGAARGGGAELDGADRAESAQQAGERRASGAEDDGRHGGQSTIGVRGDDPAAPGPGRRLLAARRRLRDRLDAGRGARRGRRRRRVRAGGRERRRRDARRRRRAVARRRRSCSRC